MIFHVTLEKAEDGWIVVGCLALPGCVSQGKDEKEAITAWLWAEDQKNTSAYFTCQHRQGLSDFACAEW